MPIETATYLDELVTTNPAGTDLRSTSDNHHRLVKAVLKATLPGLAGAAWRTQSKSSNYTVVVTDNMTIIRCTQALTLNLTAFATLGIMMFAVYAENGAVVIDPAGTEKVNGANTLTIASGSSALVFSGGTAGAEFLASVSLPNTEIFEGVQQQRYTGYTTGGTSTAYTLTPSPAITANTENMRFAVEFHTASGASPTLAVSGQIAKNLMYRAASGAKTAVTANLIPAEWRSDVIYDGTDWLVMELPVIDATLAGYLGVPPNSQNAGYTLALTDNGKHIYMASAGTFTIPANASIAFPVGACVSFYNPGASSTIAITTDTLRWAQDGSVGSRTLSQYGLATILKVATTVWVLIGEGVL